MRGIGRWWVGVWLWAAACSFPNRPPQLVVTLTPEGAGTDQPIVAEVQARDPDGAIPVLSYQWKRNGEALAEETSATLSELHTHRGDLIAVEVTAWDGYVTTQVEAQLTIADTPPVLDPSAFPPGQVTYPEKWTFQIQVRDPDEDPLQNVALEYGPLGMTVSASGLIEWTPIQPMFGGELTVHWAVRVGPSLELPISGTIRVLDSRPAPQRRLGIRIPLEPSALLVTDLEGDGVRELLVGNGTGLQILQRSGSAYVERFSSPFPLPVVSVAAGDGDGNGVQEIFLGLERGVVRLAEGSQLEARRYTPVSYPARIEGLLVRDLSGDGDLEVVGLQSRGWDQTRIVVLDAVSLTVEWESPEGAYGASLAVGNLDGDPALEIVTAGGFVFDGDSHSVQWTYASGFGKQVDLGDLDGDGEVEIVGLASSTFIRAFRLSTQSIRWELSRASLDALRVADVTGDGKAEILVGDGQYGEVAAYTHKTNNLVLLSELSSQEYGVSALAAGDLDGDGKVELVWGSGEGVTGADVLVVAGFNTHLAVEWKSGPATSPDGPFVGPRWIRDPGGPGALVYAAATSGNDSAGTRLVRWDPVSGAVTASPELGSNWEEAVALDAADYDGDGVDEVFLATAQTYSTYFTVYDPWAAAAEWTSPLEVGPGLSVTHGDLNGDGSPDALAFTENGVLHAVDVKNQATLFASAPVCANGARDAELADLDGDGRLELIALCAESLTVFKPQGAGYEQSGTVRLTHGLDLAATDANGDGRVELYVLTTDYADSRLLRFDPQLALQATIPLQVTAAGLFVEDLGVDRKNLILGVDQRFIDDSPAPLVGIDPESGTEIWRSPGFAGEVTRNGLTYFDQDGDGELELAWGSGGGMFATSPGQ